MPETQQDSLKRDLDRMTSARNHLQEARECLLHLELWTRNRQAILENIDDGIGCLEHLLKRSNNG